MLTTNGVKNTELEIVYIDTDVHPIEVITVDAIAHIINHYNDLLMLNGASINNSLTVRLNKALHERARSSANIIGLLDLIITKYELDKVSDSTYKRIYNLSGVKQLEATTDEFILEPYVEQPVEATQPVLTQPAIDDSTINLVNQILAKHQIKSLNYDVTTNELIIKLSKS
jgi:hypothetical protein